jgi:hypothetical protein
MQKVSLALLLIVMATLGVVSSANATVALCVGCTTPGQFESAAWQAEGTNFIGERKVLVVNPDSGTSNWVYLTHYPPGTSIRAKPASQAEQSTTSLSYVQTDVATPLDYNPFRAIYIAGSEAAHVNTGGGISDASATGVSSTEQAAINTAIKLTKHTYIVRLDPAQFPSYYGSQPERIGPVNYSA